MCCQRSGLRTCNWLACPHHHEPLAPLPCVHQGLFIPPFPANWVLLSHHAPNKCLGVCESGSRPCRECKLCTKCPGTHWDLVDS
jgi:hypothetical protein